ncbi:MAG: Fe-S cluster assembly protein SufD [Synechococcaceae cyanobacterium SM2_3_2]|nr:Fe-S cluster assembly protein SufD [Synechococcaceae cyanobacterium SM2_3_2]
MTLSPMQLYGRDWIEQLLQSYPAELLAQPQRQQAIARLSELGIPTRRDEAWKYTDMSELLARPTHAPAWVETEPCQPLADDLCTWPEAVAQMVLVNGRYCPNLSKLAALPAGIQIETVIEAPLSIAQPDAWLLLNAACRPETLVLKVSGVIEQPVHVLCLTHAPNSDIASHAHIQVIASPNSQLTLIEEHRSSQPTAHLSNTLVEIQMGANAGFVHLLLQGASEASYGLNHTAIDQARDSRYTNHTFQGGSALTRHSQEILQSGSHAQTDLYELAILTGSQQADTYAIIDHQASEGSSRQEHKCVADDQSRGTFNSTLRVRQVAQHTDASQSSRNLILSDKARIYTRPQLEIVADDVKCAHGATISQLEDDELFYLQSRGIDPDTARHLLTYGFMAELIDRIPVTSVREQLRSRYA